MKRIVVTMLIAFCTVLPAAASDHVNLEEGLPTEMEDAYPIKFRGREFQGMVRYIDEGKEHRVVYRPVFEFGIFPNAQLNVAGTFYSGNVDREGSGDVSSAILYNFNTESLLVPATALAVEADFPFGKRSAGVDVTTKIILSKMPVIRSTLLHRVHANLIWKRNAGRKGDEEREHQFKWIAGFSSRAGRDTVMLLDYVREQKEEKGEDANMVEAGFRRQLTPFTLMTAGAGVGFGDDSADYHLTLGFQHSF